VVVSRSKEGGVREKCDGFACPDRGYNDTTMGASGIASCAAVLGCYIWRRGCPFI